MANTTNNKSKVALAFLLHQVAGLQKLEEVPSKNVLDGAREIIESEGGDLEAFDAWVEEKYPNEGGGRKGIAPLLMGGTRSYLANTPANSPGSAPAFRCPVGALGTEAGTEVRVVARTAEEAREFLAGMDDDAPVLIVTNI